MNKHVYRLVKVIQYQNIKSYKVKRNVEITQCLIFNLNIIFICILVAEFVTSPTLSKQRTVGHAQPIGYVRLLSLKSTI